MGLAKASPLWGCWGKGFTLEAHSYLGPFGLSTMEATALGFGWLLVVARSTQQKAHCKNEKHMEQQQT